MRREAYLRICKKCKHREMDFNIGLVCGLTKKHADFEKNCDNFLADEVEIQKETERKEIERESTRKANKQIRRYKKVGDNNLIFVLKIILTIVAVLIFLLAK